LSEKLEKGSRPREKGVVPCFKKLTLVVHRGDGVFGLVGVWDSSVAEVGADVVVEIV